MQRRGIVGSALLLALLAPCAALAEASEEGAGAGRPRPERIPGFFLILPGDPHRPHPWPWDHLPRGVQEAEAPLPPGHLPPPGECPLLRPERPAGHQPPPEGC